MGPSPPLILVTGRDGQLGGALGHSLSPLGPIVSWGRQEADFSRPLEIESKLNDLKPSIIANAAAWTKVDLAESHPDEARLANAGTPAVVSAWAKRHGAFLVHYSTDYVFDGSKALPYDENDPPNPLNVYGRTKLDGDLAVLANLGKGFVFRTGWVFSAAGQNFPKTILRLAASQTTLTINDDQTGAPTSAEFLAAATALVIRDYLQGQAHPYGLYNLSSSGQTTWRGYAEYLLRSARALGFPLPGTTIRPAYGPDPSRPAKRPLNSRLDTSKARLNLSLSCPPWQDEVDKFLSRLAKVDPGLTLPKP
ncbi:MAG: dTDP-4-dehydrorhamnose reductase [Deltaproteobacteria bacterium]|jgi:dTDP-4-dehydrorhamnose reductase|nr:dTDP-4-dehydrorhamnose reductase [Deltaproteobacteria bacterium]